MKEAQPQTQLFFYQTTTSPFSSSPTRNLLPYSSPHYSPQDLHYIARNPNQTIDNTLWPHSCICSVFFQGKHIAMGCLIAERVVLSCFKKGEKEKLVVRFGKGFTEGFEVKEIHEWENEVMVLEIKTERDLGFQYGCLGCVFNSYVSKESRIAYGMREKDKIYELYLEHFDGGIDEEHEDQIGSPLISVIKGIPTVVRVCTSASKESVSLNWRFQQKIEEFTQKQERLSVRTLNFDNFRRYLPKQKYILSKLTRQQENQLSHIHFDNNKYDFDAISLFSTSFQNLLRLSLIDMKLTDDALKWFLTKKFHCLQSLDLRTNLLTSKGMQILAECSLNNLKDLNLNQNLLNNEGVRLLLAKPYPILQHLCLKNVGLSCEGTVYIRRAYLPKLETLLLSENFIGYEGLFNISGGEWPYLRVLWINSQKNQKNSNKFKAIHGYFRHPWKQIKQIWIGYMSKHLKDVMR